METNATAHCPLTTPTSAQTAAPRSQEDQNRWRWCQAVPAAGKTTAPVPGTGSLLSPDAGCVRWWTLLAGTLWGQDPPAQLPTALVPEPVAASLQEKSHAWSVGALPKGLFEVTLNCRGFSWDGSTSWFLLWEDAVCGGGTLGHCPALGVTLQKLLGTAKRPQATGSGRTCLLPPQDWASLQSGPGPFPVPHRLPCKCTPGKD